MLNKPDEVLRERLKVNWFADETHRQLAYTLLNADEPFSDFSEIELKVKEFYPKSNVTEEWLNAIKFEDVYLTNLKSSLKSLEAEYIRDRTHEASLNYAEYPNTKNKEKLEDWLRKLDELDVEDDEGELSAPIDQLLYELDNEVELGLSSFPKLDRQLGAGLEKGMMFVLAGRPGTGKGHPNWLEIPTPNGSRKFGDLKVGDYVFDRYGKPTKVTGVYPRGQLETYKVTLRDGRSTIVDGDHIWSYYGSRGNLTTKTTSEMYKTGAKTDRGRSRYAIPTNEPAHFKDKQHFIDPYVIGVLIGDGSLLERALTISSNDVEIVEKVAELLNATPRKQHENNFSWQFKLKESSGRRKFLRTKDVLADFPEIATYSHMKEIPEEYLFTGLDNRMRLLNGLFDTDGSAVRTGNRLHVSYSTTSEKLAKQIRWLLQSCGYLSGLVLDEREGRNITYNVNVLDQAERTKGLFTLPRKRKVVESFGRKKARNYDRIQIDKIEKTGNLEEITCISVENEEQLYLTNDFIVTHNTAYGVSLVVEILQKNPNVQVDFFSLEMSKTEMFKRFVARTTGINGYKFKNAKIALNDDEKRQVIKSADWFNKTGLRIHDNKFSLSAIERTIRQRKHEAEGDYLAVIDYIGLIDAEDNNIQRNQAIGKISRKLKRLTNELEIPILVMSQLNRGVEHRENKVPVLADLRESGDLEQDANVVGFLSENKERDHVIDFTIAKNRNGQLGTLYYDFFKPAMTFTETEVDSYES